MSNNRKSIVSDIRDLNRGISDAEKFFGKVLAKKAESNRRDGSLTTNKKKNAAAPPKRAGRSESKTPPPSRSRNRASSAHLSGVSSVTAKTFVAPAGPRSQSTRHDPPRTLSNKRQSPERNERTVPHKPAPKPDAYRLRSNSVGMPVPQRTRPEFPKPPTSQTVRQGHHGYVNVVPSRTSKHHQPNSPNRRAPSPHRRENSPTKTKLIPWRDLLRENHKPGCKAERGHWDISGPKPSTTSNKSSCNSCAKPTPSITSSKALTYNSAKSNHESSESQVPKEESCANSALSECNHYFSVPSVKLPEESFSSEGTSGFSSNNDGPSHLTNKSVQCARSYCGEGARPKSVPLDLVGCHSSGASSSDGLKQRSDDKMKTIAGILGNDVFTMFNPVRTLQFLIKELQGMVHKNNTDDASIARIISDMEKVLQRLPETEEPTDSSSGYTTHSKHQDTNSGHSCKSCAASEKQRGMETERIAIVKALSMVPALAKKIDERTESLRRKILESKVPVNVPPFHPAPLDSNTDTVENIIRLQRHVEHSGGQLEAMCRSMEKTCDSLRNERDALKSEVESKNRELTAARAHEQDFITTINTLRTTLESTTRRSTQLSAENKMLKEQLKHFPALQESEVKVKQLTAELNLLREEVKDIPNLRVAAEELKVANATVAKLQEENKELNGLRCLEERFKDLNQENEKLKEENKVLPHIKDIEQKLIQLTQSLETLKEEKKLIEEKYNQCYEERNRLKEELTSKTGVRDVTHKLTQRLQDALKERDEAQHEQHMLKIEREKLILLSQNKEEELNNLVKDILNIKIMVASQLTSLKSTLPPQPTPSISDVLNTSSDSDEGTNTLETADTGTGSRQPVCSSPTSSVSAAPMVSEEWNNMSTIIPDHTHSSPEIMLQAKSNNQEDTDTPDLKSLVPENWHNLAPMGQGEVDIPEDYPPRPRTAVGGPRPPVTGIPIGDNQWVGTAPVTQELHNNMEELFQYIHRSQHSSQSSHLPSSLASLTSVSSTLVAPTVPHTVAAMSSTSLSTLSSSVQLNPSSAPSQVVPCKPEESSTSRRNFQFEMPKLPDPPKFLDVPEFSDFSSYPCSLTASNSSIESIDAVLKKLRVGQKRKNAGKSGK